MRYAFERKVRSSQLTWFEAETEAEAWARALDGLAAAATSDEELIGKPIYRRLPKQDEFDL